MSSLLVSLCTKQTVKEVFYVPNPSPQFNAIFKNNVIPGRSEIDREGTIERLRATRNVSGAIGAILLSFFIL